MKVTPPNSPLPLELIQRRLKLVVLECLYDTIEDPVAQSLLGKLVHLKISGYKREYPYGATPVDTGDFIGTHLLLCEEGDDGSLEPLMGFKSLSYGRCRLHGLEFPAFHLFQDAGQEQHRLAIERIIEGAARRGEEVAYNGSWTVRQDLRNDRPLIQLFYDATLLLLVRYYTDYNIPHVIAGATIRFKVQQFKEFMGFEYLAFNGETLPTFPCKPFFNEEVAIMHLRKFSTKAIELADRYRQFWDQRLTIAASRLEKATPLKKAA